MNICLRSSKAACPPVKGHIRILSSSSSCAIRLHRVLHQAFRRCISSGQHQQQRLHLSCRTLCVRMASALLGPTTVPGPRVHGPPVNVRMRPPLPGTQLSSRPTAAPTAAPVALRPLSSSPRNTSSAYIAMHTKVKKAQPACACCPAFHVLGLSMLSMLRLHV